MKGKLYLIPNTLGDSNIERVIPLFNSNIINQIQHYIVENVRTARRFLSKCNIQTKIDELEFFELNKHTKVEDYEIIMKPLKQGFDMGIISEAGCPAIADPGADVVKLAHDNNITIIPLVGPSSILLALMASGFNGQSFAFNGYLPVKKPALISQIKSDELRSKKENQTQIYIEAPYRNMQLFNTLLETLNPLTRLCIATNLTLDTEMIKQMPVKDWKKRKTELHKQPCIFLFQS